MNIKTTSIALAMATVVVSTGGCAAVCDDDGLRQQKCPVPSASADDTGTGSAGATTNEAGGSQTESTASAGESGATESASATAASEGESDSGRETGESTWCLDADGDGFGDPATCGPSDDPPEGSVMNGDDCNDDDPNVHPGAASEEDPTLCTADLDGDGYGAAAPGPGIAPGTDCWDLNPQLNPSRVMLATIFNAFPDDQVMRVYEDTAQTETVAPLNTDFTDFDVTSASLRGDGRIYAANSVDQTIYEVDYQLVCVGQVTFGTIEPLPNPHGLAGLCGLAIGDGTMYGIDSATDAIVQISLQTGLPGASTALTLDGQPLDVTSCGLAYDCVGQRYLMANGFDGSIYELDLSTGEATLLATTAIPSNVTGIEHDPTLGVVYVASDTTLSRVTLDGSGNAETVGMFNPGSPEIGNLSYLPECDP